MDRTNLLIRADRKILEVRDRIYGVLFNEDGVETGEVVVLLAIFALFAAAISKLIGGSVNDKAAEIVKSIGGATWTP